MSFIHNYCLYTEAFANVFIFKEIHGKDSDKYSRMKVLDKFKILYRTGLKGPFFSSPLRKCILQQGLKHLFFFPPFLVPPEFENLSIFFFITICIFAEIHWESVLLVTRHHWKYWLYYHSFGCIIILRKGVHRLRCDQTALRTYSRKINK